ncbi:HEAT repeat domain-containing protein [bacterium]|nr:HEAT repeat domain-containing protein [bacterium]
MALFGPTHEKIERWSAERNAKKLLGALSSDDSTIRRAAAEALGRIPSPEVLDYCRKRANSTDQNERWTVTQILGFIGTPEAMKILETVQDPNSLWDEKIRAAKHSKDAKESE